MSFRDELKGLINKYSLENYSNTPDFILADYLNGCLDAFDEAVNARERWLRRGEVKDSGIQREQQPQGL